METWQVIRIIRDAGAVLGLAVLPGNKLVSVSIDKGTAIWDTTAGFRLNSSGKIHFVDTKTFVFA